MKKIVLVVTIIPLLTLLSCSDWLDVKPKSEIKLDVMFAYSPRQSNRRPRI